MCFFKKYFTTLCIVILTIISLIFLNYYKFSFKNNANLANDFKNLNNGDLILRCGRSTESYAVYLADKNAEFTHIGIVIIENSNPFVIHAVPHKNKILKKESIEKFLKPENASKFAIYRSNYNAYLLDKVAQEANSFHLDKLEFDDKYDLLTDSKLYCTELILKAFNNTGIHLNIKAKEFNYVVGKHSIIFPSEFTKTPIFKRII